MSVSLDIHHKFEVRFTFPVKVAELIEKACIEIAGGLTETTASGKWIDDSGNLIKDEMCLGIASVHNEVEVFSLRQQIGQILEEYGEACMWFTYSPIHGGIFGLGKTDIKLPVFIKDYLQTK